MIERFSRPYADSLFTAAGSVEAAAAARTELATFAAAMEELPRLRQTVANPGIPREAKLATLHEIGDKLGLSRLSSRFLELLLDNQRLVHLPQVLEALGDLLDEKLGVERASVTSAFELTADQQSRLKALLERSLGTSVELEISVDPELLGGFVLLLGSVRYDVSLQGELEQMAGHLAGSADEAATA